MNLNANDKSFVEIINVLREPIALGHSAEGYLESVETKPNIYTISMSGWVRGRKDASVDIEIICDNESLVRMPANLERPDMAGFYPLISSAKHCGFHIMIGTFGLPLRFELSVQAVFSDGTHAKLGTIQGSHSPLKADFQPRLNPLAVTSIARTGTTLLMKYLASHPQIAMHRVYPFENRSAAYWMHMLKILTTPANHHQSAHCDTFYQNAHWVGHHPYYFDGFLHEYFGNTYTKKLAGFCMRSIEEYYANLEGINGKIYFAEKLANETVQQSFWELYPGGREIILTRDFRDMICSIFSFNKKRGVVAFGRQRVSTDEDFVYLIAKWARLLLHSWESRKQQAFLLRYEDLILREEESLRALLQYLNIDASDGTVAKMMGETAQGSSALSGHKTTRSPKESIGRWKRDLSPELQILAREVFADILEAFGYTDI